MSSLPAQFGGVTVVTKANVYFDGNVVSHTVLFKDDTKKTLGLIRRAPTISTPVHPSGWRLSPGPAA